MVQWITLYLKKKKRYYDMYICVVLTVKKDYGVRSMFVSQCAGIRAGTPGQCPSTALIGERQVFSQETPCGGQGASILPCNTFQGMYVTITITIFPLQVPKNAVPPMTTRVWPNNKINMS